MDLDDFLFFFVLIYTFLFLCFYSFKQKNRKKDNSELYSTNNVLKFDVSEK